MRLESRFPFPKFQESGCYMSFVVVSSKYKGYDVDLDSLFDSDIRRKAMKFLGNVVSDIKPFLQLIGEICYLHFRSCRVYFVILLLI